MSRYTALWEAVAGDGRSVFSLTFDEIAGILGYEIDHGFLQAKKELAVYGYSVEKISMKNKTILFKKLD